MTYRNPEEDLRLVRPVTEVLFDISLPNCIVFLNYSTHISNKNNPAKNFCFIMPRSFSIPGFNCILPTVELGDWKSENLDYLLN